MRTLRIAIGVLLLLAGLIWFLQGINQLPGSFMTGDLRWAIIGAVSALIGLGFLVWPQQEQSEE